jgi:glycosyltransferase involved in cell wall biosynthesis
MYAYFKGFCNCSDFNTYIYFTPQSIIDKNNPWYNCDNIVKEWNPDNADILFLGGLDWRDVPETCKTPVMNLIQSIGHADNKSELYKFLTRYAIRICVSKEVTRALINTNIVNGPVYTIENHITIPKYIRELNNKDEYILIYGIKNIDMGTKIYEYLQNIGIPSKIIVNIIERTLFLELLKKAKISILLSSKEEGFYLPGIESMACGTPCIMTDCLGNREYFSNMENCIIVDNDFDSWKIAIHRLLNDADLYRCILNCGVKTSLNFQSFDVQFRKMYQIITTHISNKYS